MSKYDAVNSISFSGIVSMNEFLRIQRMCTPVWARWYVFSPCVLSSLVLLGAGWSKAISEPTSLLSDLILTAFILVAVAAITRYSGVKAWRRMTLLVGAIRGVATDWGIEWTTANTTSKFEWSKFVKVRQERDLSLVFYAARGLFYFPRSFFTSEHEWHQFNKLVRSRVKKG